MSRPRPELAESRPLFAMRKHDTSSIVLPFGVIRKGVSVEQAMFEVARPIAINIQPFADQWRGFAVGAAAVALQQFKGKERHIVVWANNTKPTPGDCPDKLCAEPSVLAKLDVLDDEVGRIVRVEGIAVAAKTQPDDETHITELTLPPCGDVCRKLLAAHRLVQPDTRLLTTDPYTGITQESRVDDMLRRYEYVGEVAAFASTQAFTVVV